METINCSICDKANANPYLKVPNISFIEPIKFQLVKCKNCNFVYLNPRLCSKEIIKYYNNDYLPFTSKNNLYSLIQKILFRWKRYIIELSKNKGNIIDIGSGNNNFIKYMSKNDWKTDNYDKFSSSTIDDIDKCKQDSYDVVTLWHSIEHIHDIDTFFINIKNILKKDGILVIACPNINSIDSYLLGSKWIAYDAPRHLYHFSPKTLKLFLSKFNFSIVSYYRMYQDTLFNIINSKDINFLSKLFFIVYSLIVIFIFKQKSSSFLYICKLN